MPSQAGSYLQKEKAPTPSVKLAQPKQKFQLGPGYKSCIVMHNIAYESAGLYFTNRFKMPLLPQVRYCLPLKPLRDSISDSRKLAGTFLA